MATKQNAFDKAMEISERLLPIVEEYEQALRDIFAGKLLYPDDVVGNYIGKKYGVHPVDMLNPSTRAMSFKDAIASMRRVLQGERDSNVTRDDIIAARHGIEDTEVTPIPMSMEQSTPMSRVPAAVHDAAKQYLESHRSERLVGFGWDTFNHCYSLITTGKYVSKTYGKTRAGVIGIDKDGKIVGGRSGY